jgi:IS5 family transposase
MTRLPDESTIFRFRHLRETHRLAAHMLALVNEILVEKRLMLKTGSVVDATLIPAPSSTKNNSGKRDPEMRQTQKGGNWHFGMKPHISEWTRSPAWFTRSLARRPMFTTSRRPKGCCTGAKRMCTLTPDISGSKNVARLTQCAGMLR